MGTRTVERWVYTPSDPVGVLVGTDVIETFPTLLSKTSFMDLAWAQLGGGTTGMARFNAIMTACKTGNDVLQAVYDRYTAAVTFEKGNVGALTQIMVGATVMTSGERDAILNNWPEA